MSSTCTTAGSLVSRAASLLNDAAFERWTQPILLDYLTEGLRIAVEFRPDISIERRVVTLTVGTAQKLPADVTKLLSVDLNVARLPDGTVVEQEHITSETPAVHRLASAVALPPGCDLQDSFDCATYRVRSALVAKSDPRAFFVSPPVPPGCSPEITVTLVSQANLGPLTSAACVYVKPATEAALVEWMMYRALGTDSESTFSYTASQTHLRNFYALLDGGHRAATRVNADLRQRQAIPTTPAIRYAPQRARTEN